MAEYIEREAICYQLEKQESIDGQPRAIRRARRIVADFPATDVVPVVRCKDCKYRHDDDFCGGRGWPAQLVPDDGYCDRGVKKDSSEEVR